MKERHSLLARAVSLSALVASPKPNRKESAVVGESPHVRPNNKTSARLKAVFARKDKPVKHEQLHNEDTSHAEMEEEDEKLEVVSPTRSLKAPSVDMMDGFGKPPLMDDASADDVHQEEFPTPREIPAATKGLRKILSTGTYESSKKKKGLLKRFSSSSDTGMDHSASTTENSSSGRVGRLGGKKSTTDSHKDGTSILLMDGSGKDHSNSGHGTLPSVEEIIGRPPPQRRKTKSSSSRVLMDDKSDPTHNTFPAGKKNRRESRMRRTGSLSHIGEFMREDKPSDNNHTPERPKSKNREMNTSNRNSRGRRAVSKSPVRRTQSVPEFNNAENATTGSGTLDDENAELSEVHHFSPKRDSGSNTKGMDGSESRDLGGSFTNGVDGMDARRSNIRRTNSVPEFRDHLKEEIDKNRQGRREKRSGRKVGSSRRLVAHSRTDSKEDSRNNISLDDSKNSIGERKKNASKNHHGGTNQSHRKTNRAGSRRSLDASSETNGDAMDASSGSQNGSKPHRRKVSRPSHDSTTRQSSSHRKHEAAKSHRSRGHADSQPDLLDGARGNHEHRREGRTSRDVKPQSILSPKRPSNERRRRTASLDAGTKGRRMNKSATRSPRPTRSVAPEDSRRMKQMPDLNAEEPNSETPRRHRKHSHKSDKHLEERGNSSELIDLHASSNHSKGHHGSSRQRKRSIRSRQLKQRITNAQHHAVDLEVTSLEMAAKKESDSDSSEQEKNSAPKIEEKSATGRKVDNLKKWYQEKHGSNSFEKGSNASAKSARPMEEKERAREEEPVEEKEKEAWGFWQTDYYEASS